MLFTKKKKSKLDKKTADYISMIRLLGNVCRLTQHVYN